MRAAPGEPLLLVDGISGLGAMPFEMDAWGVDVVVSASQKAWMASPGIAIAAVGPRARAAGETARMPRFYWDFAEARSWAEKGQTPWTPAIAILYGLRVGVQRLRAEGRERTWARHASIAAAVVAGMESLGLRPVAPEAHRSSTVTAAWLPDAVEWAPFNAAMRGKGLVIAGGQGKWAGRILRFGHMGDVGIEEMAEALEIMGEHPPRLRPRRPMAPAAGNAAAGGLRGDDRRRAVTDRRRILLVRHGVTDWNREGRFQGHLDPPLADDGRLEAELLGARLQRDELLSPVRIVSSTLARARQTAESIGAKVGVAVEQDARLIEIGQGEWEGRTHDDLAVSDADRYAAWRRDAGIRQPPGGESIESATQRVTDAARGAGGRRRPRGRCAWSATAGRCGSWLAS